MTELQYTYYNAIMFGVAVAQSIGTWLGTWRVSGSRPSWTTISGVWPGGWRGAGAAPECLLLPGAFKVEPSRSVTSP